MIKWLYTDATPSMKEDAMIELMHMAKDFDLTDLSRRSEEALKPMITRTNCVKFYQLAEEIESKELIDYTGNIVSENWDQLGPEELESVKVRVYAQASNVASIYSTLSTESEIINEQSSLFRGSLFGPSSVLNFVNGKTY